MGRNVSTTQTAARKKREQIDTRRKQSKARGIVGQYLSKEPLHCGGRMSSEGVVDAIREGLPVRELELLRHSLGIPMENLARRLGISKATLHRRKAQGRLAKDESDRVVRYARLMGKAMEVFENEQDARLWLSSPQFGLAGAVPLGYAETEAGAREVEDLLGRIEFGVYS
jgi:putative toxin-antitoxin system antitoxin component (TIGR02293 family)